MKKLCKWIVCLFCMLAAVQPLWAKEKTIVAVLPFAVHSAENIDYVRQGVGDMLSSRISVSERIEVLSRDVTLAALKETGTRELTLPEVTALGKKLNADFVVWGSITKIGSGLSIDGKLIDIATTKSALAIVALCKNMDEVIPKVTDFAQKIESHILGAPAPAMAASPTPKEIIVSRQQPTPQTTREAEIISGMKGNRKGTFTSSINPDFINAAEPLDRKTFWKSQQFPVEFKGMDIGDVNGDGLNETVMIDNNSVFIYQKKGDEFRLIQKITGKSYNHYIAVDVADINQNGIKEIIVSSYSQGIVNSFVIEFKNGAFVTIAADLRWFMRVIENSSKIPFLLGQRMGVDSGITSSGWIVRPFDTPIHEIVWQNGEYREGRKMRIPQGLSIYGLTLEKLGEGGTEKIISLNDEDLLCVYEQTDKPLSKITIFGGSDEFIWKSEDTYGGSNTTVEPVSQSTSEKAATDLETTFINLRIVSYDVNKDGKPEFILVKNISSSARLFSRLKLFSSAEIYDLEWDGSGMVENWRTKKISGYVADYQFKDINNDGENEVVLAVVLSVGGTLSERSVLIAYSLTGR
ncbi:MAG: FG-GAP-like repeat-containing protein [Syntrophales bacterium]